MNSFYHIMRHICVILISCVSPDGPAAVSQSPRSSPLSGMKRAVDGKLLTI